MERLDPRDFLIPPWPLSCCWAVPASTSRIPPASPAVLRGLVRRPNLESTDDTAEK